MNSMHFDFLIIRHLVLFSSLIVFREIVCPDHTYNDGLSHDQKPFHHIPQTTS